MGFIVVYFLIVFLVIEIAVVLMRATGLEFGIARFQVVSLLTGTGFTTKESELILGHPVRRKIGIFLILFGAFSLAVVISSISSILAPDIRLLPLSLAVGALLVLFVVLRLPATGEYLSKRMTSAYKMSFDIHELSIDEVLLLQETDTFVDIPIGERSDMAGRTLDTLCDRIQDLNVLLIKRGTIAIREKRMSTPLEAGDVLYVYGSLRAIQERFGEELAAKTTMEKDEKLAAAPL